MSGNGVTFARRVSSTLVGLLTICFTAETSRLSGAARAPCLHQSRRDGAVWIAFVVTRCTLQRQEPDVISCPHRVALPLVHRQGMFSLEDKRRCGLRSGTEIWDDYFFPAVFLWKQPEEAMHGFPHSISTSSDFLCVFLCCCTAELWAPHCGPEKQWVQMHNEQFWPSKVKPELFSICLSLARFFFPHSIRGTSNSQWKPLNTRKKIYIYLSCAVKYMLNFLLIKSWMFLSVFATYWE